MNFTFYFSGCRPPTWPSRACERASWIRRRYEAGLRNFFRIYRPLAASWRFYDNSVRGERRLIADGARHQPEVVFDQDLWNNVNREWR